MTIEYRRPLVIVESPFAAANGRSVADHLIYLRRCLRHSFDQGEAPFASHALYPFFLDDSKPDEREAGIRMGYSFWDILAPSSGDLIAFYTDLGMSPGMQRALKRCDEMLMRFEIRNIGETS